MTDNVTNEFIFEQMKRFQATLDRVERKLDDLTDRVGRLEIAVASHRREMATTDENTAAISVRVDRINERIDRIERRLELKEA